ncbi:hypothetical protein T265_04690 [Opisthorchis viverrini]|uniref:Uncharacterized protein n=1 Tax=Opisthorchis viverrini TaxID=6198 RepID=A0A074ZYQ1_OPIVI|nr:hypothetical protein T265_04690 [Opisthorchis viverrini]KER28460.1 hypothetical protein T265_04690 [Opisthorchis viverrini]
MATDRRNRHEQAWHHTLEEILLVQNENAYSGLYHNEEPVFNIDDTGGDDWCVPGNLVVPRHM